MFQNLTDNIALNNKDVKENKKYNLEKIKDLISIQNIIIYILSFLVSTVVIRNGIAPFAFAFFVAACSSVIPAGPVLMATALGVFISQGIPGFLVYFLQVLIFLFTIVFFKPYIQDDRNEIAKLGKNLIIACIVVHAIKLSTDTLLVYDVVVAILNIIFTYVFYKIFVNSIGVLENFGLKSAFTIEEIIGATMITAIAAVSLSSYRVYGISLSNVISVFLILILAWKNGLLVGSTIGVSLGLILGIIGAATPIQVLAFAISGLLAGAVNKLGRVGVVLGFLVGNALISYLATGNTVQVLLYKELVLAGIAIFFVPKYIQIDIEGLIGKNKFFEAREEHRLAESEDAGAKLNHLSKTVKEIAKTYGLKDEEIVVEIENINKSKEAFVEDLLNNLDSFPNNILYEDLIDTNNGIIEKIYMILAEKEEISEKDMVSLYEDRNEILDIYANQAIREDVNQVIRIVNRTYRINEMNFQWKQRLNENRKSISKQLKGVSKAISDIAVDLSKNKENIFEQQEAEIKELLKQKSILVKEIRVKQNKSKKFFIDILFEKQIKEKDKIKCIESILTKVCKEKIVFQKDTAHLDSNLYMQKYISEDKYTVQLGLARLPKSGNDISGDSCIQFKLDDNKHLVALSDGMGAGAEAKKSSQIVAKLLRQTLTAGFEKEVSMDLINSTVKVSTEEIYATMDVAIFDLYNGVVEFIKNGACKTYIKNKQILETVDSNSLPLGILNEVDFTVYDRDMKDGDIFIMCSDGIVESNQEQQDDKWLVKVIKEINTNNVKKMADIIMNEAIDNGYGILKDDMTVIVAKVNKI